MVHNAVAADQIQQMIPWNTVAWVQVHQGHLPLWNPYSLMGLPLAFNWQSASFSLPTLIGYLVPLHLSYSVEMFTKLVIAGTGVYLLSRVLAVGPLCSAFAGTVFMLSGPLMGWLGWPLSSVMIWAGWLFAATLLLARGQRRARSGALLAVVTAFSIYGGSPEATVMLAMALFVFMGVLFVIRARSRSGPLLRPAVDITVGGLAGCALAAPLLLPGLQLINVSARGTESAGGNLPPHDIINLAFQSYYGLPTTKSLWFDSFNYYETAAYIGVIGVVMAFVAVAVRWRRPHVTAFASVAAFMGAVVFFHPVTSVLKAFPSGESVIWTRALMPCVFALAVLSGIGLETLVVASAERRVRRWACVTFVVTALGLGALAVNWALTYAPGPPQGNVGQRQKAVWQFLQFLRSAAIEQSRIRGWSFVWPGVEVIAGLLVVGALTLYQRQSRESLRGARGRNAGRLGGLTLLVVETTFLIAVGAPLWSSSAKFFETTPAVDALQRAVGTSTVGFTACTGIVGGYPGAAGSGGQIGQSLGILPNANAGYGIKEFAATDPLMPSAYYRSWSRATGRQLSSFYQPAFCPVITTADVARLYGVRFVLEPHGATPLAGGVFVMTLGGEELIQVPGAAPATLTPDPSHVFPSDRVKGSPIRVRYPNPSTLKLETDSDTSQVLRVRLTDVPGWHGTIDGRALPLRPFSTVMLQADIPPGRHTVEFDLLADNVHGRPRPRCL